MEWVLNIISGFFSGKIKDYKEKVEKLRSMLDELEKRTVPMIRVENDEELLIRAKDYLKRFKGQSLTVINGSLLPAIERLVNEIDLIRGAFLFKLLKRFKFKIPSSIRKCNA